MTTATERGTQGAVPARQVRLAEQVNVAVLFDGRQHDVTLPASSPVAAVVDALVRRLQTDDDSGEEGLRSPDENGMVSPGLVNLTHIDGRPLNRTQTLGQQGVVDGDLLVLDGSREGIFALNERKVVRFTGNPEDEISETLKKKHGMAEVVLLPTSRLVGQTLRELKLRKRFGIEVLGIQRRGKTLHERLMKERLQIGDQLLIHGDPQTIASLENDDSFRIISDTIEEPKNTKKAPYALIIFVLSVGLAAANVLPLAVSTMIGALLIFVTRCITPAEAYKSMNWSALILIGCMLALGKAMDTSGLASYLAGQLVNWIGTGHAYALLAGFFLLAMILTQPMSNQAAAVVVLPIAIETALQLGLNPRTFAMMIAVGAATSYITPLEPACMMVYGPGNYRFMDFVKVGSLLTILIFGISMLLVPVLWPF